MVRVLRVPKQRKTNWCAEDLFTILLGLSMAWFTCGPGQQAATGAAAQQRLHAFRRSLLASTDAIVKTMTQKKR
ncbi:hypothetical protein BE17_46795 [Sorangium cellulosum]|uniref:Uncharacterized protein n=1 Tax=Sorangium cellulosum TaxID=56 RepID=A0A150RHB3_SORCE|nr:hypothetical protein BE17_46795 [Sorangium cellulosum]